MPNVMSELATTVKPVGIVVKTTRRVAVALTMLIVVGGLMLTTWRSSASSLFLRTIILGLSATAAFAFFEVWPRAAIVRQKEAFARDQKLTFALERSELERQALDARLHLLQAQVAPHFLFNTLANVQALVDTGSPHASAVLRSLTACLRAAVPLLHEPAATIERELQLVRPYL